LVTQDFGTDQTGRWFITGVVYYDVNGNGAYDLGEGVGGVTVVVDGAAFYSVTAGSGGYSVPVTQNGDYTVTFSLPGTADAVEHVTIGGANVKVDHPMSYPGPVISGPSTPLVAYGNTYSFSTVPGATGYQWQRERITPFTTVEGAEDGGTDMTATISSGYTAIDSSVSASGQNSFHLAQPQPDPQILTLNRLLRGRTTTSLSFASRLTWATTNQVAHVQISTNTGASWSDIWTQSGDGTAGEDAFSTRTVPLPDLANQEFSVRFLYQITGSYFQQADSAVGWHIDDITFSDADEILDHTTADVPAGTAFSFRSPAAGVYLLSVRPIISGRAMPWGTALTVSAAVGSPPLQIVAIQVSGTAGVLVDFSTGSGSAQSFQVQGASDPAGPWTTEAGATFENGADPNTRRAHVATSSASRRFFRVVAQ
jgi:hypothetical protein